MGGVHFVHPQLGLWVLLRGLEEVGKAEARSACQSCHFFTREPGGGHVLDEGTKLAVLDSFSEVARLVEVGGAQRGVEDVNAIIL